MTKINPLHYKTQFKNTRILVSENINNDLRTQLFNKLGEYDKESILSILEQIIKDFKYENLHYWLNNL